MKSYYQKHLQRLLVIFVVAFILLFVAVYFWQNYKTRDYFFTYNGFRFQRDQYGYKIQLYINGQDVPASIHLREDPRTLEDIPVSGDLQILREKQQIYVTLDPYANLTSKTSVGALEIDSIIDNPYLFNIKVSSALTQPYINNTVKTCKDVTAQDGVILFQTGTTTDLTVVADCVIVQGVTEDDIIRASDRLVYTLLKIMKP